MIVQWNLVNNKQGEAFFKGEREKEKSCCGAVFGRKTKKAEDKSPAEKGTFPLLSVLDQFRRRVEKENMSNNGEPEKLLLLLDIGVE